MARLPRRMGWSIGSWPTSSADPATMAGLIQSYLDHLTVERGMSRHTLAAYGRDLRRYAGYLAELGITDPCQVTSAMISSYGARLREGKAAPVQRRFSFGRVRANREYRAVAGLAAGMAILHCPPYIREWIAREQRQ